MATLTATGLPLPAVTGAPGVSGVKQRFRRRRLTPEAGRALEILGHGIDYLVDEFVYEGGNLTTQSGENEAIQLLMAVNRKVYFDCPEGPLFRERIAAFFKHLFR